VAGRLQQETHQLRLDYVGFDDKRQEGGHGSNLLIDGYYAGEIERASLCARGGQRPTSTEFQALVLAFVRAASMHIAR